jgi:Holliday junction resolvase RusA-like endonuclease
MTRVADFVEFEVHGIPVPQGSKTAFAVTNKQTGKTRAVVTDKNKDALHAWRDLLAAHAVTAMEGRPAYDEAMVLEVTFGLPKPPSVTRDEPTVPPDLDKLLRAVFDALKTGGVYRDDSRVVQVVMGKVYSDNPGATIVVFPLKKFGRDGATDLADLMMSED